MRPKILVTRPFQAPFEEVASELKRAWDNQWLTNNGPLLRELENSLSDYLNIPEVAFVSNGTIALQLALKALDIQGEVITTPFSYVATTSSLVWEQLTPVFVDIDPETFNLDPAKIEAAITERTSAILATHVFGLPCDVEAIEAIAKRHGLKVIYDGAHAFGSTYKGKSVLAYGDMSTLSTHATKLYHSVEGGAVMVNACGEPTHESGGRQVCELRFLLDRARNFGHNGPEVFTGVGINGKNSEFHAAVGLVNLRYLPEIMASRKRQHEIYDALLDGVDVQRPAVREGVEWNYSYYPVVFRDEAQALRVMEALAAEDIFARRYFYPLLSNLPYIEQEYELPVAARVSDAVLCLPLYVGLEEGDQERIGKIVRETVAATAL